MSRIPSHRAWLHGVGGCVLSLVALLAGRGALGGIPHTSPGRLAEWWSRTGPILAVFSVVRLGVLIAATYWTGFGLVRLLVKLAQWLAGGPPAERVWRRRLPALVRVAGGLAGGSIAGAAVLAGAAAATGAGAGAAAADGGATPAATPGDEIPTTSLPAIPGTTVAQPAPRLVPLGAAATRRRRSPGASPGAPSSTTTTASPATTAPPTVGASSQTQPAQSPAVSPTTPTQPVAVPGGRSPESTSRDTAGAGPSTASVWTVKAGDSLWSIAESVLAERLGRPPSDSETGRYWVEVIAANRSRLPDPRDPSLIFAGDVIALPPA